MLELTQNTFFEGGLGGRRYAAHGAGGRPGWYLLDEVGTTNGGYSSGIG